METNRVNILITAASRRVALIRAFANALADKGMRGKVIVTDTDPLSPGLYFCDKNYMVPLSTSPDYIPSIKKICAENNISLLVPTIDEELPLFGHHKEEFMEMGVQIPLAAGEVGEICNDKYRTYLFFKEHGLPMAETWLPEEVRRVKPELPLFIKPRFGRGAVEVFPVNTDEELKFFMNYVKDPVIQKFLPGNEYTVDVLSDFEGRVISVVPRQRLVIRSGVCDRGRTEKNLELMELSKKAAETLGLIGPSNLQCKINDGDIKFFEVNPRFSGAIQLTISAGADFPRMILQMMNGGGILPCIGNFEENLTMVSYEESIYRSSKRKWRR